MGKRIIEKLKNQQGSSLAFVLIIGMMIMIMVASLLAVANSDFTFTQETVESRQAYIDAKSVIEYGKIEINERMKWLEIENKNLKDLYTELAKADSTEVSTIQTQINNKIAEIEAYMKVPYYIGGDEKNIAGTLKEITGESDAVGILNVTPEVVTAKTVSSSEELKYVFKITTQKLRRKLDYQADFNYTPATSTQVTPGTPAVIPDFVNPDWRDTQIKAKKEKKEKEKEKEDNKNNDPVFCVIQGDGAQKEYYPLEQKLVVMARSLDLAVGKDDKNNDKNDKFDWQNGQNLDLTARNIDVVVPIPQDNVAGAKFNITALRDASNPGQIRFEENYIQVNGDVNTLSADNIVFMGNLEINNDSYLVINCANLWVEGNITINTNDPKKLNDISAANIFVNGTITTTSNVKWTYTNFWLNGVKKTDYPNLGNSGGGSVVVTPGKTGFISEMYY